MQKYDWLFKSAPHILAVPALAYKAIVNLYKIFDFSGSYLYLFIGIIGIIALILYFKSKKPLSVALMITGVQFLVLTSIVAQGPRYKISMTYILAAWIIGLIAMGYFCIPSNKNNDK